MRALLVVNPKATTTSERSRNVLMRALRTEMELRVGETRRRGHAAELARQAVRDKLDAIVVLGGDGTVNEVVNGMLAGPAPASGGSPVRSNLPSLAVVPGGSTNVFARALGMPNDAIEATGAILEAMHDGRTRTVSLGRVDGRYFTFCAGFGLDAEVVRKVERARLRGKVSTPALYIRSTVTQFFLDTERHTPKISLERPGERALAGLSTVIIQNTAPWTYLGNRPINPCPDASFDTGLDVMALRGLHTPATALTIAKLLAGRRSLVPAVVGRARGGKATTTERTDSGQSLTLHDLSGFTLTTSRPVALQVDGDYLGERTKATFTAIPEALRVFA
jgi:diacylglycerol kinase family enzyme